MGNIIKNLNGIWKFKIDPIEKGEKEEWYLNNLEGREVKVPAVWQSYNQKLTSYTGSAWYSKKIKINSNKQDKRFFIEFNAVDYITDVWFNGQYLGKHEGGYTPFKFEITDYINYEEDNLLVVKVFDPQDNGEIPRGKQGSWYTRVSGIWQDVRLIGYEESFIEQVLITPNIDQSEASLIVDLVDIENLTQPKLEITVFSPKGNEKKTQIKEFNYQTNQEYKIKIDNPLLWSPKNPWIYDVKVTLKDGDKVVDNYKSYFGMRKVEQKNGKIYLNDEPLYIRGALDQAFWPKTIYRAETEDMIKDEIMKAKNMGFNLLRKHIKTEDPRYLYWADHLGILIWGEAPNYARWTPQAKKRFKDEYTKMVTRDYNHPSIIIWSIYNEEWGLEWNLNDDPKKQEWVIEFYNYAKKLDNTRLICDNSGWAHVKTDISDLHRYFAAPDNYQEWQDDLDDYVIGDPDDNFVDGYKYNNEPLVISEFGMWGLPEIDQIKDYYNGLPTWYDGSAKLFSEDFKVPATAKKNFNKYGLDKIFTDINELARLTQKREFRGIKYIIEEIRKRAEIAGYVVTELTDIEWETNGFLDYFRNPKQEYKNIVDYNGKISAMLDIKKRNLWTAEKFVAEVKLVNNTCNPIEGTLVWKVEETDISGELKVNLNKYSVTELNNQISFVVPEIEGSQALRLKYSLQVGEKIIAKNQEELTFTNKDATQVNDKVISTVNLNQDLTQNLRDNGYQIKENFTSLCITSKLTPAVINYLRQGGKVIFLAEEGAKIKEKGMINFKRLEDGESWDKAASFNYINPDYFNELPLNKISGWELANLFPSYTINNLTDIKYDVVLAGSFKGWIGQFGASLLKRSVGKGNLIVTTLKLAKEYNNQPIGTLLFNELTEII
ncbi:beta-galactosidase/beta-glucuronidase [Halobacteroides halobius DSM 5150]|uniref:Beta-galactosidase/beta-glucuronidase n=1 Tax=Halobacteroides halobius (strain ATCC 35273 / DSM 5150 / MD-1) TaxID=748449 RepID=L0KB02_HALHC|nr:sugar-binding domain-containing protein [Halobacteroides halobius]AGB41263.1 beta-galactosidase/beta-glucuronidase [Halobacteroides halobius DSM 5150]